MHPLLLEHTVVLLIETKLALFSVISNEHSPQVMGFLRAAVKFTKPELLHQEEDGSVQAFRGEAYEIHQIKLQHVKICEECQEVFLNPAVDLAEG